MSESAFGFDEFVRKWIPPRPPWDAAPRPAWLDAGTEEERRRAYLAAMERAGGEGVAFDPRLSDLVRSEAAAGVPILELLERLVREPGVGDPGRAALLFQRAFGVPSSRSGFIASWRPGNHSREAQRALERVSLCVEDARRAGLWEPPPA